MGIHILGTGSYTPPCTLTNADLSEMVETNDEWIRTRTGISVRHVSDGEPTWYMGVQAAQQAIATAGIDPADIGLIIDTTITGEFCTPSMSCIIQRETKAVNAACFDLNAACSGFVYAMDTAHRFLMTDPHMKYALVVANESLSKITNYSDRSSCILFGDGAAAAIIEYAPDALYTSHLGADGTGAKYLYAHSALPRSPFVKAKPLIRLSFNGLLYYFSAASNSSFIALHKSSCSARRNTVAPMISAPRMMTGSMALFLTISAISLEWSG